MCATLWLDPAHSLRHFLLMYGAVQAYCAKGLHFSAAFHSFRHSDEMIKKLQSTGLGYYVRETEERLGTVMLHIPVINVCMLSNKTSGKQKRANLVIQTAIECIFKQSSEIVFLKAKHCTCCP